MRNPIIEKLLAKSAVPISRVWSWRYDQGASQDPRRRERASAAFEGVVIAQKRGAQPSFTVRKISFGQAWSVFSARLESHRQNRRRCVRPKSAAPKLYYLRGLKARRRD